MTIEQLDQYGKHCARWSVLDRKIRDSRAEKADCVVDIVEGSNKSFPFQRVHFSVAGLDPEQLQRNAMRIRGLDRELDEIEAELMKIETYIADVTDPIVKTSMELHFINGVTWPQASKEIYGTPAQGNSLRMAATRYVEKNP